MCIIQLSYRQYFGEPRLNMGSIRAALFADEVLVASARETPCTEGVTLHGKLARTESL